MLDAQYNKYKKQLIESKIPDGTSTTVYRCGPMIDLCVGPHIPHTGKIKSFMVTKVRFSSRFLLSNSLTSNRTEFGIILPRRPQERLATAHLRYLLP